MHKKNRFGKYELQYDTIIDHDAYEHLRITFEVPRGQDTNAMVLLNGREVGVVSVVREGKKIIGYQAFRLGQYGNPYQIHPPFKHIGRAAAAIITDLIQ
jgi:hypothetical protein